MKSEPSEFSIDNLQKVKKQLWEGVRNYQVRNMFRDDMQVGDHALFYHSSISFPAIVGEMEIVSPAETDLTQFNEKSKYYDAKSKVENPRWLGPIVSFVKKFEREITLAEIKLDSAFNTLPLVKKGNRLSVFPITKSHYEKIIKLANKK